MVSRWVCRSSRTPAPISSERRTQAQTWKKQLPCNTQARSLHNLRSLCSIRLPDLQPQISLPGREVSSQTNFRQFLADLAELLLQIFERHLFQAQFCIRGQVFSLPSPTSRCCPAVSHAVELGEEHFEKRTRGQMFTRRSSNKFLIIRASSGRPNRAEFQSDALRERPNNRPEGKT